MVKTRQTAVNFIAQIFVAALGAAAQAQSPSTPPGREQGAATLLNKDYLTSTGATVPHPGAPQGTGVTPLDRGIQQRDNQVEKGICSNC